MDGGHFGDVTGLQQSHISLERFHSRGQHLQMHMHLLQQNEAFT